VESGGVPAPLYGGAPTNIPYTDEPVLLNREDVRRVLAHEYPDALRKAGIGGTVLLWLLVDEQGDIVSGRVKVASGRPALDAAALRVAAQMRFAPGRNHEEPVKVWAQVPVVFPAGVGPQIPPGLPPAPPPLRGRSDALGSQRTALPRDMPPPAQPSSSPSLLNGTYIDRQLRALFEQHIADRTARGTAVLRLRVDSEGNATTAELASGSGNAALDSLALSLRPMLVFVPAIHSGRYAEGEVKLPVRFPPE